MASCRKNELATVIYGLQTVSDLYFLPYCGVHDAPVGTTGQFVLTNHPCRHLSRTRGSENIIFLFAVFSSSLLKYSVYLLLIILLLYLDFHYLCILVIVHFRV